MLKCKGLSYLYHAHRSYTGGWIPQRSGVKQPDARALGAGGHVGMAVNNHLNIGKFLADNFFYPVRRTLAVDNSDLSPSYDLNPLTRQ